MQAHLISRRRGGHALPCRAARLWQRRQLAAWHIRHPVISAGLVLRFARTCVHAAKLLPTVRAAVPWYVWPVLALAALVKCLPLDMGTDEALFTLAALLIAWRRPGLLKALFREAQAGRPVPCSCERHGATAARRGGRWYAWPVIAAACAARVAFWPQPSRHHPRRRTV